jgi:hypothetical protein
MMTSTTIGKRTKTTMANGPKLWKKLLSESPKGSVLMGGAVVDYAADVEPKDYDIFYKYVFGPPNVPENWFPVVHDLGNDEGQAEHAFDYAQGADEHGNNPIGAVYNYIVDNTYKVQLVGVLYEDPKQHFRNFDHSLTLGYFSQRGLFVHRKVFESFDKKIVEYVGKDKSPQARAKSLFRAHAKTVRYGGDWNYLGFQQADGG